MDVERALLVQSARLAHSLVVELTGSFIPLIGSDQEYKRAGVARFANGQLQHVCGRVARCIAKIAPQLLDELLTNMGERGGA